MIVSKEIAGKQGRKGLKVVFTSDKKRIGGGAQCIAQCIDPAPTTTPTPGTVQHLLALLAGLLHVFLLKVQVMATISGGFVFSEQFSHAKRSSLWSQTDLLI